MRHVTDTGKQIEASMRQKHGSHCGDVEEARAREDMEHAERERPEHPIAAMGAAVMAVLALAVALTATALFFVGVIAAVPLLGVMIVVVGGWAFWSWGKRRRAAGEH